MQCVRDLDLDLKNDEGTKKLKPGLFIGEVVRLAKRKNAEGSGP